MASWENTKMVRLVCRTPSLEVVLILGVRAAAAATVTVFDM